MEMTFLRNIIYHQSWPRISLTKFQTIQVSVIDGCASSFPLISQTFERGTEI